MSRRGMSEEDKDAMAKLILVVAGILIFGGALSAIVVVGILTAIEYPISIPIFAALVAIIWAMDRLLIKNKKAQPKDGEPSANGGVHRVR